MHLVPVKSVTQQAQGMVLKVRETLVGQRTQMTNTLRGHAAEFGVIAGKGLRQIGPLLTAIEQETTIPAEAREMAALLGREIEHLDARIKELDVKLAAAHKANEVSQRLATIPGVGPVTALTLAIEVDPAAFESGRHLAAWAGLTPREHSTGGKQRMGGISRAGNERLRVLLVTGATSVIKAAMRPGSALMTDWLRGPVATQAAQGRCRGARQQDGPGGMGADDARGGVPAPSRRRSSRGVIPVIRAAVQTLRNDWEWKNASSIDW
jgi:transposase